MALADIIRIGGHRLTPQQIADMALQEDQARRRAIARGDMAGAMMHDDETARLCDLIE